MVTYGGEGKLHLNLAVWGKHRLPLNGVDEIKVCTRKFNITHLLIFLHEGGGLTEAASLTATNSFQFSGGKKFS